MVIHYLGSEAGLAHQIFKGNQFLPNCHGNESPLLINWEVSNTFEWLDKPELPGICLHQKEANGVAVETWMQDSKPLSSPDVEGIPPFA